jgi:DNA-binding SARP family transcriptional activator
MSVVYPIDQLMNLHVRLLGPVRAWQGDRELDLGAPRRQAVLGMLAMRANQTVSRGELIDGMWGEDPPPSAVNALHVYVAGLRRALEPHRVRRAPGRILLASSPGYLLRLQRGQLDAEAFGQHMAAARESRARGDLPAAATSLDAALRLWQATPLAGVLGPWAEIERVRLGELRLTAIEERIELMLALGANAEAAAQLAGLVREHPLSEGFRGQLMLALYRSGRQAEALAVFTATRRLLVEELGIEPGPRLRRLHERVLAADAALDPPPVTATLGLAHPQPAGAVQVRQVQPVAAQLPLDTGAFIGRAGELAALDRMLAATIGRTAQGSQRDARPTAAVISVVWGTAGVGKTGLAVHWAHRVHGAFPDGQLYVNLRGCDPEQPVPAGVALAGFLRALGMEGPGIPLETDERAAAYRTLLDRRRMLVVLDNAATAEQVRPLLPGSPSSLVLVTSRDSQAGLVARHGAKRLDLDVLPLNDAVALLRVLIGGRADTAPAASARLARLCARLPLALRVAAELAAAVPAMTVAQLADEMADERRRLDLLDAGGDPRSAVRSVFSWSYRCLPTETARLFRLLGLHNGPDVDLSAAAALTASTHGQARRELEQLARGHMIHRAGPGRYVMHDLLRAYAADLTAATDTGDTRRAALTRLFEHYAGVAAA